MKYLELTLRPADLVVHPVDRIVGGQADAEREALLHLDARPDGTTVLLYRLSGERDPFAAALSDQPSVRDHEIIDAEDGGFYAFVQADAGERGGALVELAHRYALIVDTPLEFVDDGVRATLVGSHENLRAALSSVPDGIEFAVMNAGPYTPGCESLLSPLTDRQLEVFETAVEAGYYEIPRRATHADIAASLDCAPSTVDEHLRKAESRVVSELVQ